MLLSACHGFRIQAGRIFLQFVVQRFQADAEYLSGTSLVIVGGLQSLHDQLPLGFADGCSYSQMNRVGIDLRYLQLRSSESRRIETTDRPIGREF